MGVSYRPRRTLSEPVEGAIPVIPAQAGTRTLSPIIRCYPRAPWGFAPLILVEAFKLANIECLKFTAEKPGFLIRLLDKEFAGCLF